MDFFKFLLDENYEIPKKFNFEKLNEQMYDILEDHRLVQFFFERLDFQSIFRIMAFENNIAMNNILKTYNIRSRRGNTFLEANSFNQNYEKLKIRREMSRIFADNILFCYKPEEITENYHEKQNFLKKCIQKYNLVLNSYLSDLKRIK